MSTGSNMKSMDVDAGNGVVIDVAAGTASAAITAATTITDHGANTVDDDDAVDDNKKHCLPCCDMYEGNTDALGLSWLASGRGMLVMSNIFMSTSLLWLAKDAAGCYDDPTTTAGGPCEKEIYGMKAESIVTNIATIGALLSAFFMPICGAIVDYTPYRKHVGVGTAALMILIQAVQVGTVEATWFVMGILQALAAFIYQLQIVVVFAYLPEISRTVGEVTMTKVSTNLSAVQYLASAGFLILITAISLILKLTEVRQGQISQGVNTVTSLLTFGLGWFVYLSPRPAVRQLRDDQTLLLEGFKQNWRTAVSIQQHYKKGLRWFLLAVVFGEASATAVTTVSIVYLTSSIGLTGTEVGIFYIIVLFSVTVGTLIGKVITTKTNPNTSWKLSMVYLFVALSVGAVTLDGIPSQWKSLSYIWAVFVGLGLGWYYPTENLFFSMCIPPGQEAELAGFFLICGQILAWMFPLMFTILIENNVSQKYGVVVVATGFLISTGLLMLTCSWEEILEEASHARSITSHMIDATANHKNDATTGSCEVIKAEVEHA